MGELIALLAGYFVILMAILVFFIACQWKIYSKAGKPGWACLVPIYNIVVLLEIVKKPIWWILLMMIPIVNFVIMIIVTVELAKAFGKSGGYAAGLLLLPIIFYPMLAFGDAKYVYGDKAQPSSDLLDN
jgi:hypothetical protein